jgi:hypothetical protein
MDPVVLFAGAVLVGAGAKMAAPKDTWDWLISSRQRALEQPGNRDTLINFPMTTVQFRGLENKQYYTHDLALERKMLRLRAADSSNPGVRRAGVKQVIDKSLRQGNSGKIGDYNPYKGRVIF